MGWSIGYDDNWNRWIGYGVPAWCDHPDCIKKIDRGLAYVCGGDPHGGEYGCGLYFCSKHLAYGTRGRGKDAETVQLCQRCLNRRRHPFRAKPEHPEWIHHVSTDASWAEWRAENPKQLAAMQK